MKNLIGVHIGGTAGHKLQWLIDLWLRLWLRWLMARPQRHGGHVRDRLSHSSTHPLSFSFSFPFYFYHTFSLFLLHLLHPSQLLKLEFFINFSFFSSFSPLSLSYVSQRNGVLGPGLLDKAGTREDPRDFTGETRHGPIGFLHLVLLSYQCLKD